MSAPLIPERLKECREALGLNKVTAAKKLGLTQSGYVRYENGERKPTIQIIESMAATLGTSVAYLTGESNVSSPDRLVVLKDNDPILFEISNGFDSLNKLQKERLLAYYREWTEIEKQS